jgi:hypothetical protein
MEKFTPIEIKWVCGLLERTSHELLAHAEEAEETGNLDPQLFSASLLMRLKAEQYADISARFRNALERKSKRIEIKY